MVKIPHLILESTNRERFQCWILAATSMSAAGGVAIEWMERL
jgi:hypothetical protein